MAFHNFKNGGKHEEEERTESSTLKLITYSRIYKQTKRNIRPHSLTVTLNFLGKLMKVAVSISSEILS